MAPAPCVCWEGTFCAEAHRHEQLLWTKSRNMNALCPGQHCTAHCQQQTTPVHPTADTYLPSCTVCPSSAPRTGDITSMLSQTPH